MMGIAKTLHPSYETAFALRAASNIALSYRVVFCVS
jgi:hypothetical protein